MTSSQPSVVFLDAETYGDVSLRQFTRKWNCTIHQVTSPADTAARLTGHSIVVTNKVAIDQSILDSAEARSLRLIVVAATGTDIINRDAAARRGITVCNVPGYATQSVAQFTIALILELATHAGRYGAAVKCGQWQKSSIFSLLIYPQIELCGKKLGIIGYGNIGRSVAQMARGLGLEILIAARPGSAAPELGERIPVTRLFAEADIISLHCPLTAETRHLINACTLSLMKPSAFLINTARGALIDEAALIDALRNHRIAAAALDVISQEPPPADHAIVLAANELDNLFITPHTAWSAREARERLLKEVQLNIVAFLDGRDRNRVA